VIALPEQPVTVVVGDVMAQVSDQGAVPLTERSPQPVATHRIRLGEVDGTASPTREPSQQATRQRLSERCE
jgi:hypothetical protein